MKRFINSTKMSILLWVLVGIIAFLNFYFGLVNAYDAGGILGEAIFYWILLSLVLLLFFKLKKNKQPINKKSPSLFLIILVFVGTYHLITDFRDRYEAKHAMASYIDTVANSKNSEEVISSYDTPIGRDMQKLERETSVIINKYRDDLIANINNESSLVEKMHFALSPNKIITQSGRNNARTIVHQYITQADLTNDLMMSYQHDLLLALTELNFETEFGDGAIDGLTNSKLYDLYSKLNNVKHKTSETILNIIELIESNEGHVVVSNSQYIFDNQEALDKFNQLYSHILPLEAQETQLLDQINKLQESALNNLQSAVSGPVFNERKLNN